jgi:hypothetical protein
MNNQCENIRKELRQIEYDKSVKCYNNESVIKNQEFCISLLYKEWLLKIDESKYCRKN